MRRALPLVLALLVLLPAPARAAGPQPGLVVDVSLSEADYARLKESNTKLVRLFMYQHDYNDAAFRQVVGRLHALGIKVLFVVMGDPADPPRTPDAIAAYARFVRDRAKQFRGDVRGWEIWNEQDADKFWAGAPPVDGTVRDTRAYTALLKATHRAVRTVDRRTPVVMGGLTGNNYRFVESVYRNGGRGSFDAVAVHTDTGCSLAPPDGYLRDLDGRINQFAFLSYREVRKAMVRHGDRRKPIWMTELGWSTTTRVCDTGKSAGIKAGGVSEALQAQFTRQAFHCMRVAGYVKVGIVFRLRDEDEESSFARYGLLRPDGSPKPVWDVFRRYTRERDRLRGPCGDFTPPRISIQAPRRGKRFPKDLRITVRASDRSGVPRITLLADGRTIRNFTDKRAPRTARGTIAWQGAKRLPRGRHVITVLALDRFQNTARRKVVVIKTRGG